jgi:Raf kinase inhibitor-like YbhB/YbcL family protein
MKKFQLLAAVCSLCFFASSANAKMSILSPNFKEGELIKEVNVFNGFGCSGKNISPEISISEVPKDAKSLAITLYDPDAPTGSGWWHWIVYNIPTSVKSIPTNDQTNTFRVSLSKNALFGRNDFGTYNYGGPCPPVGHGKHHYILTVYALSVAKLNVQGNSSAALIGYNINANLIEKASITATYQR